MKITKDDHITIIKLNPDELSGLQGALAHIPSDIWSEAAQEIVNYNDFFGKRESDKPAPGKPRIHKPDKKSR